VSSSGLAGLRSDERPSTWTDPDRSGPAPRGGNRRFARNLALVAIVAFAWRAGYTITVLNDLPEPSPTHIGLARSFDEYYYQNTARYLTEGIYFKEPLFGSTELEAAEHPPLTSLFLAPVALVTDSELALRLAVSVAGVGVVVLAGSIGRAVAGPRVGIVAAVLAAAYPNLWVNDGLLMSETFGALLSAAVIYATYRLVASPGWRWAAAVGVLLGLAMLSRDELALFAPLLVAPATLLIRDLDLRSRLRLVAVSALAAAVVIAPWVGYNLARFEKPVILGYSDGATLLGANCDTTYSGELFGFWDGRCAAVAELEEQSRDAEEKRSLAFEYIEDHTRRLPAVVVARQGRMWSVYRPLQMAEMNQAEGRPEWASVAGVVMFWALVPVAIVGAVRLRRGGVPLVPLVAPFVVVVVIAAISYGLVRLRVPAEVPLVVLGAVGLVAVADRALGRRQSGISVRSPVPQG
jgi:4-amino-4-deoxy-L-arabinose transferase-like glycosyltransferase